MVELYSPLFLKIIGTFVILVVGIIFARIVTNITKRVLKELEVNKMLKKTPMKVPLERYVSSLIKYIIYFVSIIVALNYLGIPTIVLQIILLVFLGLIVVIVILAFKDIIPNFISGVILYNKKGFIKIGDIIKVRETEGKVITLSLTETVVKTKRGDIVHIPNSIITKEKVIRKK